MSADKCRRCGRPESAHCPQCNTCWPGETCSCNPDDDPQDGAS